MIIPYTPTPSFDCSAAQSFEMTLSGNVTGMLVTGVVPGRLYTWTILEDATGGRAFPWGSAFQGASEVNAAPGFRTTQTFLGAAGGLLLSTGPGTSTQG